MNEKRNQIDNTVNVWSIDLDVLVDLLDEQAAELMGIDTDALYSDIVGDVQTVDKLESYSSELSYYIKQWLKYERMTPAVASYINDVLSNYNMI